VHARRHVLGVRRGLSLTAGAGRQTRKARQFDSLRTFASQSLVRLDTFLDMPTAELYSESRSDGERSGLCQDLRALAAKATEMAGRIEKV
ncbi:MAG: hypothetical protein NUV85_04090, partial [Candidatus Berkelbacteria bacterium]|nr:hypothetical protein [Candidatus Berkelbacteria bacterium]